MADYIYYGLFSFSIVITCMNSNFPPYYPHLAKEKGVSDTIIGFIFGIQPIISACSSPIIGISLHRIGRTNSLLISGLLMSASAVTLGIASFMPKSLFILLSFIERSLHGLSSALLSISSLSIISTVYNSRMEKLFGLREQINEMCVIIGPMIGIVILTFAEFETIFFFYAVLLSVQVLFFFKAFPPELSSFAQKEKISWRILLALPAVLLDCGVIASTFGALGALEPILANYLTGSLGIDKKYCAFIFIIPIATYPISVAVSNGFFPNTNRKTKMKTGLLMISIALMFLGPCEFTGLPSTLAGTILSLFLLGAGIGPAVIPALPDMNIDAIQNLPDIDKNLISDRVSSLFPFCIFLGKSVFSILSGILSDRFHFNRTTTIISCIILLYLLIYAYLTGKIKQSEGRLLGEEELVDIKD